MQLYAPPLDVVGTADLDHARDEAVGEDVEVWCAGGLEANVHTTLHAHLVDGPGREWFHVSASDAIHAIAIAMR